MDWLAIVGESSLQIFAWLVGLAIVFAFLGSLMPCNRGMYWWKDLRNASADLFYWFLLPLFGRSARALFVAAGAAFLFGGAPGFSPVRDLPLWLQCGAVLVIQDVLLYWLHRAFHTRPAWRFHAIHHSPTSLDWLSAPRFHFVNVLFSFVVVDVVVILMGFSPAALALLAPCNLIYSGMVHANLNWTFGRFRHIFASPVFHRWHHTREAEGIDKNFAPTFPLLDVIFGTFYMPAGKLPQSFGTGENDVPEDFWGQLIHPFKRGEPSAGEIASAAGVMTKEAA